MSHATTNATPQGPTVACPTCKKPVEWRAESLWRPFCSERCKLIDLGDWASESHVIPGVLLNEPDLEDGDQD
ncbi:Domain of unknown function (DUF329) [gamma proteobacterium HdN1]|nr:Domain of unknown function (DUF329) [gamma proteobacterium HdN1]